MSKKYDREEKIIDRLEKQNRELKQQVRTYQKLLKQANKGFYKLKEDNIIEEKDIPKPLTKLCWDCSGELLKIEILNRRWYTCKQCGKRTKTKFL